MMAIRQIGHTDQAHELFEAARRQREFEIQELEVELEVDRQGASRLLLLRWLRERRKLGGKDD